MLGNALHEVRLLNPQWHEETSHLYYLTLLRWLRSQRRAVESEASQTDWKRECLLRTLYQLRMYPEWEQVQRDQGLRPARDVEMALRWDGSPDNSGRGYEIVSKYMSDSISKSQSRPGNLPDINR